MTCNIISSKNNEYELQHRKLFINNCEVIKSKKQIKKGYYELFNTLEKVRDKLSYKIMVPLPAAKQNGHPLAFIEGVAVHTNEIIMPLGCNYFQKGTVKVAMDLCMRKSKEIEKEIHDFEKEQTMVLERLAFLQLSVEEQGQTEIIEEYNEDEDEAWRKKHAENLKKMKKDEAAGRVKDDEASEYDYFARLDELEMLEHLEELKEKEEK